MVVVVVLGAVFVVVVVVLVVPVTTPCGRGEGESEDDRINSMMSNSTEMYSDKHWVKFKGQKVWMNPDPPCLAPAPTISPSPLQAFADGSKPPPHWKCSKCLANHWVSDCPFANNDMKRTTGIPRSGLHPRSPPEINQFLP